VKPSSIYLEFQPSSRFASTVECFWILSAAGEIRQAVLPDGCCDFIFSTMHSRGPQTHVVGTMTKPRSVTLSAGDWLMGVRFHPGAARPWLPCPAGVLTDQVVPLDELWGERADELLGAISPAAPPAKNIAAWERVLGDPPESTGGRGAIARWIAQSSELSLSQLAGEVRVSDRQFRRVCLNGAGLTPKKLARVLRFRRALAYAKTQSTVDMTQLAVDCGYFDQSHMIRDFNEFAGHSPCRLLENVSA
jgi:AraC-like DNA-binding protein